MSSFKYGYAMNDIPGDKRIITPPMLGQRITLSLGHTSTFVFLGTKPEILEWFRTVGHSKTVHTALFFDQYNSDVLPPSPTSPISPTTRTSISSDGRRISTDLLAPKLDLVFDLFPYPNPDLTFVQYCQSFYKDDPTLERFRLEIRPEQPKVDSELEPLYRMYARSGVSLGEMAKGLEKKWSQPSNKSFGDMVKEVFMEREEAQDWAQEVAEQTKKLDDEGREVDLEDVVITAPTVKTTV
ncbi:hypothetical protein BG004_005236 [Podila humilis]|nr:hypothetical protein BG004_005236 [Podila humilis]